MTSHKEQPAVDTSAKAWRLSINYGPDGEENYANVYTPSGVLVGNLRISHARAIVEAFRSLAAHPAEPAGMELETTAVERRSAAHGPSGAIFLMRLLRDFDRVLRDNAALTYARDQWKALYEAEKARAEKAEAERDEAHSELTVWRINARQEAEKWDALSTQLRDAQARGNAMEEALEPFAIEMFDRTGRYEAWATSPDDTKIVSWLPVTVGDFRRASAVLSRPEGSAS